MRMILDYMGSPRARTWTVIAMGMAYLALGLAHAFGAELPKIILLGVAGVAALIGGVWTYFNISGHGTRNGDRTPR